MSGRVQIRPSSLRRQRAVARLPRIALLCAIGVLALVGVHTALAGRPSSTVHRPAPARTDLQARAFAESFARAYLSWDSERPEDRAAALRGYLSDALDPAGGLSVTTRRDQRVEWTTVTGDVSAGAAGRVVTVAAAAGDVVDYLAVPVRRHDRGFLYVSSYPALVGGPPTSTHAEVVDEPEVGDGALRTVVSRALSNYLAREARNLRADLDAEAVVSLPPRPLRLDSVDGLTRVRPGWVAAQVSVTDLDGVELSLRYELRVVRRDRWYVRSIGPDPTGRSSP
jgi:conjugative transposon protein TcpC